MHKFGLGLGATALLLVLAACAPLIPESGPGFGGGKQARAATDGATRNSVPVDSSTAGATLTTVPAAPGKAGAPAGSAPVVVTTNNPGISDEQSFKAVTSRESIKSDRERLALQRAEYKQIPPKPLPRRVSTGPSVFKFALSTTNRVGQKLYRRFSLTGAAGAARRCLRYDSNVSAQLAFLRAGGPEIDRLGLDPDGDGFACGFNPDTYRKLVN